MKKLLAFFLFFSFFLSGFVTAQTGKPNIREEARKKYEQRDKEGADRQRILNSDPTELTKAEIDWAFGYAKVQEKIWKKEEAAAQKRLSGGFMSRIGASNKLKNAKKQKEGWEQYRGRLGDELLLRSLP